MPRTVTIDVEPDVLQWAIRRSGDEADLFERHPQLEQWLDGTKKPTLRQLENFASAARVPFGYLFLPTPPHETLPFTHFRTVTDGTPSRPSPDLLETVYTMERRQEWLRNYLIEIGADPLPFVGVARPSSDPVAVAEHIATTLGFENRAWASASGTWRDALLMLRRAIDAAGIVIAISSHVGSHTSRLFDVAEFRGFVLVDPYAPILFVNGRDAKAAQMFTIAHELAHIWLGVSAAFDLRGLQPSQEPIEQQCNRIAAEFLVPAQQLLEFWPLVAGGEKPFAQVARHFKVSQIVAARRALDLNLITREEFFGFYNSHIAAMATRSRKDDGGNFYTTFSVRVGNRFAETVVRAAAEGRLLYTDAYSLLGLKPDAFDTFSQQLLTTR